MSPKGCFDKVEYQSVQCRDSLGMQTEDGKQPIQEETKDLKE